MITDLAGEEPVAAAEDGVQRDLVVERAGHHVDVEADRRRQQADADIFHHQHAEPDQIEIRARRTSARTPGW